MNSPTAAITLTQISQLSGLCPEVFSRHSDVLPPTHPVHTGSRGRPQKAFDIDDLAAFIAARTGHMSEAIVRLRLALAMGGQHRIVEVDNRHVLVHDHEDLADLPSGVRDALMRQIHEEHQRRTRRPAQEQQP